MRWKDLHILWIAGLAIVLLFMVFHHSDQPTIFFQGQNETSISAPLQAPVAIEQQPVIVVSAPIVNQQHYLSLSVQEYYALKRTSLSIRLRQERLKHITLNLPTEKIASLFFAFW